MARPIPNREGCSPPSSPLLVEAWERDQPLPSVAKKPGQLKGQRAIDLDALDSAFEPAKAASGDATAGLMASLNLDSASTSFNEPSSSLAKAEPISKQTPAPRALAHRPEATVDPKQTRKLFAKPKAGPAYISNGGAERKKHDEKFKAESVRKRYETGQLPIKPPHRPPQLQTSSDPGPEVATPQPQPQPRTTDTVEAGQAPVTAPVATSPTHPRPLFEPESDEDQAPATGHATAPATSNEPSTSANGLAQPRQTTSVRNPPPTNALTISSSLESIENADDEPPSTHQKEVNHAFKKHHRYLTTSSLPPSSLRSAPPSSRDRDSSFQPPSSSSSRAARKAAPAEAPQRRPSPEPAPRPAKQARIVVKPRRAPMAKKRALSITQPEITIGKKQKRAAPTTAGTRSRGAASAGPRPADVPGRAQPSPHSWEFAITIVSIELNEDNLTETTLALRLTAHATNLDSDQLGSPPPQSTAIRFWRDSNKVKPEDQVAGTFSGPSSAAPDGCSLTPSRLVRFKTNRIKIDDVDKDDLVVGIALAARGDVEFDAEAAIAGWELKTRLGRRKAASIKDGRGKVVFEWMAKPVMDYQGRKEAEEVDALGQMFDRLGLIELERDASFVWLPDPPLPDAEPIKVPLAKKKRGKGKGKAVNNSQWWSWRLREPIPPGSTWEDPARDFTTRFAAIDRRTVEGNYAASDKLLVRMHGRWRTVYPFPGEPTWLGSETRCWKHFGPAVAYFGLFDELRDYLGRCMVKNNLLSQEDVEKVVGAAKKAGRKGPGYVRMRDAAMGRAGGGAPAGTSGGR